MWSWSFLSSIKQCELCKLKGPELFSHVSNFNEDDWSNSIIMPVIEFNSEGHTFNSYQCKKCLKGE